MRSTDPGRMATEEILGELGELLAVAFQRHISCSIGRSDEDSNPSNPLDVSSAVEAPCGEPEGTST